MLWEAWAGVHDGGAPLAAALCRRLIAGLGIGMVAALLGLLGVILLISAIKTFQHAH